MYNERHLGVKTTTYYEISDFLDLNPDINLSEENTHIGIGQLPTLLLLAVH